MAGYIGVQQTLSYNLGDESCIFPVLHAFVLLNKPRNKFLAGIWNFLDRLNVVGRQPPEKKLDVSGIIRHLLVGRSSQNRTTFRIEYERWFQDAD
jgi:hypothetical protein